MVGVHKINVPGCRCCKCVRATTGDASTVASGTWSSEGIPTAANSIRLYDNNELSGKSWHVSCGISYNTQASGSDFAYRLIGGASDVNNYVFIEFRLHLRGASAPFYSYRHSLGKVVAGVETILAKHPNVSQSYYDWGDVSGSMNLELCWDGSTLIGQTLNDVPILASENVVIAGGKAGFGVTTYTNMDLIEFANIGYPQFYLTRVDSRCEECELHCCGDSPVPTSLTVEISGMATNHVENWNLSPGQQARLWCETIDGTYTVTKTPASDDGCIWSGNMAITIEKEDAIPPDFYAPPETVSPEIQVVIRASSPTSRIISVYLCYLCMDPFEILEATITDDCITSLTDWVTLTPTGAYSGSDCDFTGVTMRIKKV